MFSKLRRISRWKMNDWFTIPPCRYPREIRWIECASIRHGWYSSPLTHVLSTWSIKRKCGWSNDFYGHIPFVSTSSLDNIRLFFLFFSFFLRNQLIKQQIFISLASFHVVSYHKRWLFREKVTFNESPSNGSVTPQMN